MLSSVGSKILRKITGFASKELSSLYSQAQASLPFVLAGMSSSFTGIKHFFNSDKMPTWRAYVIQSLTVSTVIFAAVLFLLAPVVIAMVFLVPGTLLQLLLSIPYLSYRIINKVGKPMAFESYSNTRAEIDSNYRRRLTTDRSQTASETDHPQSGSEGGIFQRPKAPKRRGFFRTLLSPSSYLSSYMTSWALGLIPLVGPVIGGWQQLQYIAISITMQALEPWFREQGWNKQRQEKFRDERADLLVGFGIPFALVSMIPVLGSPFLGISKPAIAFLVVRNLDPRTKVKEPEVKAEDLPPVVTKITGKVSELLQDKLPQERSVQARGVRSKEL